ncbi:beta-galactosidase [Alkalihalobacillus pseudalcaliphilus]|uniref:beta-galactosidase n=1 Tax=Alkalihalobacillus pseudalcaliphilus TaxID=79884 RepID=UPI00064DD0F6|nr:beta-galactosidase [Alkalihalobacillus pseudalcaliphilus]KMK75226.1 beta-galactosidase [Alkalihalobacillus pseudalcaliphilus]
MISDKLPTIWYGGDYNPEQWQDPRIWEEDIRMFKLAGINIVTLNVFSWALNQLDEKTYRFDDLEEHIDRLYQQGIYTCLATSTAAHPAWMASKYPDVLRVDFQGRKRAFGGRHNSCPNSPTYRHFAEQMADQLGKRFKGNPAVLIWHVSNEYGGYCYCENCANAFRKWLKEKYLCLEALNKAWNTTFWGHTFYEWDEIVVPNALSEEGEGNVSAFQGISLDYRIFQSESLLACYQLEHDALKKHTPHLPITTNLMGTYPELDYFKWGKAMDIVSWDSYPGIHTPTSLIAMTHDLMRGLKQGQPFMLMEQTPSQQNWQPYNSLKRPGVMRLWSYQAIAHGADTVMFFQLRRSIGACEKFHGAVIEHVGHEHTRVFKEVVKLGSELAELSDKIIDSRVQAKVAIVYDWENRWAIDLSSGPTVSLDYVEEVHKYYKAFYDHNIPVDMVSVNDHLLDYDLVIAPVLYMVKKGYAKKLTEFVQQGGTFITTFFSGIVNEHDLVTLGGYPGELKELLGIWVEEIDAMDPAHSNQVIIKETGNVLKEQYDCHLLFDLIHTEGAEVLAEYGSDFYQGTPVVTSHQVGKGKAIYIGTSAEQGFINDFMKLQSQNLGISSLLPKVEGVEVMARSKDEKTFLFILNHNSYDVMIEIEQGYLDIHTGEEQKESLNIPANGVSILEEIKSELFTNRSR